MRADGQQRQRHGVAKNIVEGIGGVLVGAALVLFVSRLLKPRTAAPRVAQIADSETTGPTADPPTDASPVAEAKA